MWAPWQQVAGIMGLVVGSVGPVMLSCVLVQDRQMRNASLVQRVYKREVGVCEVGLASNERACQCGSLAMHLTCMHSAREYLTHITGLPHGLCGRMSHVHHFERGFPARTVESFFLFFLTKIRLLQTLPLGLRQCR